MWPQGERWPDQVPVSVPEPWPWVLVGLFLPRRFPLTLAPASSPLSTMSRCRSGKLSPQLFPVFVWWISSSKLWMKAATLATALVSRLWPFEVTKNTSGWTPKVSNAGKTDDLSQRPEHTVGKWQDIVAMCYYFWMEVTTARQGYFMDSVKYLQTRAYSLSFVWAFVNVLQ